MTPPTIGLMTFHAAHNYGSVLQAYATQKTLDRLGLANEIIHYRLSNQLKYYNTFFTPAFGMKTFLQRLPCLAECPIRKVRAEKFERFIRENLRTTEEAYHTLDALRKARLDYSVLLVGSDQVWNRHCVAEFATEPTESILAYLLDFGSPEARRIAFSSSVGSMTQEELREFIPQFSRFSSISMRESSAAAMIADLIGREVETTLDPTLMLSAEEWKSLAEPTPLADGDYLLLYSLKKPRAFRSLLRAVQLFVANRGWRVVALAPFAPVAGSGVVNGNATGPREFLSLVSRARLVITDSFHGTAFSVNFRVPFFVLGNGKDQRKHLLLRQLGLEKRILGNIGELALHADDACTFEATGPALEVAREKSWNYLLRAMTVNGKQGTQVSNAGIKL